MKDENEPFEKGDKVIYQYTHWLNGKSSTQIAKEATFIRKVKQPVYGASLNPKVVIQCKGNKTTSTVYLSEIRHEQKHHENKRRITGEV